MSISTKSFGVGVQVAIMLASIGVFLGGVALVGGGFEDRSTSFWVTVASIVFAQFVWFNVPIWMTAGDARSKNSFPFQFTAITFCTLYVVAVFFMAILVTYFQPGSGWVYLGHMVLLLGLASSLGMYAMANRTIGEMDQAEKIAKSGAANLNMHIKSVQDRATICVAEGVQPAQVAIGELVDAMHYATGESLPGSESVDAEITASFKAIEVALMAFDGADVDAVELVARILQEVKIAKLTISRRESLIKTLR
jgi:hypothetical protein